MNKIVTALTMTAFLIAATSLQAQRGNRGEGRSFGNNNAGSGRSFGNGQPSRSFSPANQDRSNSQRPSRSFDQPQRSFNPTAPQRSFNSSQRSISPQQNNIAQQRSFSSSSRFNRPAYNGVNSRSFGSNRNNVIVQNNFYGNRGGGFGYRPPYRSIGTYRYHTAPRLVVSIGGPYSTIPWLGIPYNYYNGFWYRPYGTSFRIIAPPIGISIGTLPFGYSPVFGPWGNYYYYNNVFYRHPINDATNYEVVDAPLGAQVPELPKGAEVRVINDQKYYELDGTFYKEDLRDGQIWYTVVGKKGVLSTYDDSAATPSPSDSLTNGDRISLLPDGSRTVTINGQQLYLAPNGNYYQQVIDGNNTWYEMVGN